MSTSKKAAAPAEEKEKATAPKKPQLPAVYDGNVKQFLADCAATPRDQWTEEQKELHAHYSK